jgi:capping protein alpha
LITKFNDLGGGRFVDSRSQQTFKYDPLREEASQLQEHVPNVDLEEWRLPLEQAWTTYCKEHYRDGTCAVFATSNEEGEIHLSACIEDHQFQPKNFWNGRWRSVWTFTFNPNSTGEKFDLEGSVKVQVHYYEDGNVQLVSSKEMIESLVVTVSLF